MIDPVTAMFDSAWWPLAEAVLLVWGLMGLIALMVGMRTGRSGRWLAGTGVALMFGALVASMLVEDLLPQWQQLAPDRRLIHATGLAMILSGLVVLVLGGALWTRRTLARLSGAAVPRATRWLGVMALGGVLIVLGASLTHDDRFPIPWFWAVFGV